MKGVILILLAGFLTTPLFAQCTMQESGKHIERKDQYSKSSAQAIKASQNAMAQQSGQFQRPKYAAEVKPNAAEKRNRQRAQY